jgi:hypothetical protein
MKNQTKKFLAQFDIQVNGVERPDKALVIATTQQKCIKAFLKILRESKNCLNGFRFVPLQTRRAVHSFTVYKDDSPYKLGWITFLGATVEIENEQ